METDFVGRGFGFPLRVDATGRLVLSAGPDSVEESVVTILSTAPGERIMRPLFGCKIWDLLFAPLNSNTLGLIAESVREAIGQWEPRAELDDVRVDVHPDAPGAVQVEVDYRVRDTNDRRNLVFPFYVIPREEER